MALRYLISYRYPGVLTALPNHVLCSPLNSFKLPFVDTMIGARRLMRHCLFVYRKYSLYHAPNAKGVFVLECGT